MTTIEPGQRLFDWQILAVQGRQATCRCRCNQVRIVAIEHLISGVCTSCGCSTPSTAKNRFLREAHEEKQRRRLHDWKLENGR
jgi:hypothetical protein